MPKKEPRPISGIGLARDLLDQMPDVPSRTLAARLVRLHPERFKDIDAARSAVRKARGAQGKRPPQEATHKRPHKKPGDRLPHPPSMVKPWLPYELPKPCVVLALSDGHIPFHEPKAIEAAIDYGLKYNPDVVLLNGDWADFYSISRWQKNPELRDFPAECGRVEESLMWLRGVFPKAHFVYKAGNHEERYDHYIWERAPDLFGLANIRLPDILHLDNYGIEWVADKRPVMAGVLPIFHGHELPRGLTNPVNMARGAFLRVTDTVLVGHGHRSSSHTESRWDKKEITTWSQGCLCDMFPQFMPVNKWNWGAAIVEVDKEGQFQLHNFRISQTYKVRAS